ncbi:hypothetical protein CGH64_25450, partial [Vibrio parahaemolyticus]
MFSIINSKISTLSMSIGLGKCLQKDLFEEDSLSTLHVDNDTDCTVFCGDNLNHLIGMSEKHSDSV